MVVMGGRILAALLLAVSAAVPGPRLVVEAPPSLAQVTARVRTLAQGDFSDAMNASGLFTSGAPIRVILAPPGSSLARHAPSWVSGYALGALDTVVLFPDRVPSYPDGTLRALLHHEVTHILVWRASRGGELPRWFNEGVAAVAAREWGLEDRARTVLAVIGHAPESTVALDAAFLRGSAATARAYALSAALVRTIQRRFGADAPARIIRGVGDGERFDEAFLRVTGTTPDAVARQFFSRELFWSTWVPFLTSSGALWMGITLLALYAIRRRRQKDAELRARWAEEDGVPITPPPPSPPPRRGGGPELIN